VEGTEEGKDIQHLDANSQHTGSIPKIAGLNEPLIWQNCASRKNRTECPRETERKLSDIIGNKWEVAENFLQWLDSLSEKQKPRQSKTDDKYVVTILGLCGSPPK
jgi:hypothetical protein